MQVFKNERSTENCTLLIVQSSDQFQAAGPAGSLALSNMVYGKVGLPSPGPFSGFFFAL